MGLKARPGGCAMNKLMAVALASSLLLLLGNSSSLCALAIQKKGSLNSGAVSEDTGQETVKVDANIGKEAGNVGGNTGDAKTKVGGNLAKEPVKAGGGIGDAAAGAGKIAVGGIKVVAGLYTGDGSQIYKGVEDLHLAQCLFASADCSAPTSDPAQSTIDLAQSTIDPAQSTSDPAQSTSDPSLRLNKRAEAMQVTNMLTLQKTCLGANCPKVIAIRFKRKSCIGDEDLCPPDSVQTAATPVCTVCVDPNTCGVPIDQQCQSGHAGATTGGMGAAGSATEAAPTAAGSENQAIAHAGREEAGSLQGSVPMMLAAAASKNYAAPEIAPGSQPDAARAMNSSGGPYVAGQGGSYSSASGPVGEVLPDGGSPSAAPIPGTPRDFGRPASGNQQGGPSLLRDPGQGSGQAEARAAQGGPQVAGSAAKGGGGWLRGLADDWHFQKGLRLLALGDLQGAVQSFSKISGRFSGIDADELAQVMRQIQSNKHYQEYLKAKASGDFARARVELALARAELASRLAAFLAAHRGHAGWSIFFSLVLLAAVAGAIVLVRRRRRASRGSPA